MSQRVAGVPPVVATGEPEGLNMAEIELSVLSRQCLDRRIPDFETLEGEVKSWDRQRNQKKTWIDWRFTADDARTKLHRLYPSTKDG